MAYYIISGNLYAVQEYTYQHEIEADSPEDAAAKFRELAAGQYLPIGVDLDEVDIAYREGGTFHVFEGETDSDAFCDPDSNALLSHESLDDE